MSTKPFDCVEMKRRGAAALQDRLKGLTEQEQAEYWRARSAEFSKKCGHPPSHAGNDRDARSSVVGATGSGLAT